MSSERQGRYSGCEPSLRRVVEQVPEVLHCLPHRRHLLVEHLPDQPEVHRVHERTVVADAKLSLRAMHFLARFNLDIGVKVQGIVPADVPPRQPSGIDGVA